MIREVLTEMSENPEEGQTCLTLSKTSAVTKMVL